MKISPMNRYSYNDSGYNNDLGYKTITRIHCKNEYVI